MSSLLRFPRRNHNDHLKEEHLSPLQSPSAAASFTESVRERRLSALSFISERFTHKPKLRWPRTSMRGMSAGGIGHMVDFPGTYSRDSTPSPTASLEDIQIPVGLGRRASESELQPPDTPQEENVFLSVPNDQRNRTHSAPSSSVSRTVKRKSVPLLSDEECLRKDGPAISRMPTDLLTVLFSYATRRDVLSLTRVSKAFSAAALRALYGRLDLRAFSSERIDRCVNMLASNRAFAGYVRHLACAMLPPPDAALSAVAFAIAITNMHALESLTLPDYDARFLTHTSFRLKRLRIMSEFIAPDDWKALWAWLAKQPELTSLSFPHLLQNTAECNLPPPPVDTPHTDADATLDTLPEDTLAQPGAGLLPSHFLPRLAHFHGPASLTAAIVPGRPVCSVKLHVHTTLYDGLKPSAIMGALTRSRTSMTRLVVSVSLTQVDARTLERVFMSAGSALGSQLEVLAVEWALDDEVLYKQLSAVLPRFRTLHTVRLRRRKVELPRKLAKALNAFPSPPESPMEPTHFAGAAADPGIPPPRAQERAHLAVWAKQCSTLRTVLFLSGAEWRTGGRGGAYALPGERPFMSGFGFVGFVYS
ncbi:uncharacterized protein C8Q71DRAFT_415982 [Rhodofomes roseus]|uniref:F-box domain-containing protein n=1 Tax=Rhodofomes roseus TaxID=34475 RepID=A0ABQ8KQI8_9APHY|nr:uncharacterized protein C8Q71DRAFT_415982 [Rhodofomes roseus]KAH9840614.1 hypothetical protein C8Q71DRAFT_415982 [Rhodofomes roseus]